MSLAVAGKSLEVKQIIQIAGHPETSQAVQTILRAVVSALVRSSAVAVPAPVQTAAVAHAVAFTQAQVGAMPGHFRVAFAVAVHAFDRSALRHGAPTFAALRPAAQDRLLAAWAASPLPQPRQFLRLVRASSLLGFFEYPPVARAAERAVALP